MVTHKFAQTVLGTYRLDLAEIAPLTKDLIARYGRELEGDNVPELSRFLPSVSGPPPGARHPEFLRVRKDGTMDGRNASRD